MLIAVSYHTRMLIGLLNVESCESLLLFTCGWYYLSLLPNKLLSSHHPTCQHHNNSCLGITSTLSSSCVFFLQLETCCQQQPWWSCLPYCHPFFILDEAACLSVTLSSYSWKLAVNNNLDEGACLSATLSSYLIKLACWPFCSSFIIAFLPSLLHNWWRLLIAFLPPLLHNW